MHISWDPSGLKIHSIVNLQRKVVVFDLSANNKTIQKTEMTIMAKFKTIF